MIFNNERYETVAFWDKYKHVVNVYDTAEKKVKFHIANRREETVHRGRRCPRLACVASPVKRGKDE